MPVLMSRLIVCFNVIEDPFVFTTVSCLMSDSQGMFSLVFLSPLYVDPWSLDWEVVWHLWGKELSGEGEYLKPPSIPLFQFEEYYISQKPGEFWNCCVPNNDFVSFLHHFQTVKLAINVPNFIDLKHFIDAIPCHFKRFKLNWITGTYENH